MSPIHSTTNHFRRRLKREETRIKVPPEAYRGKNRTLMQDSAFAHYPKMELGCDAMLLALSVMNIIQNVGWIWFYHVLIWAPQPNYYVP